MAELKRCPFCGGEAKARSCVMGDTNQTAYWVECCSCFSQTETYYKEERAIEAWNSRPSNWNTGTPTEIKGWYLIKYKQNGNIRYIAMENPSTWVFINDETLAWQKIEQGEVNG